MTGSDELLDAIEAIAAAAVGVTVLALSETPRAADLTLPQWRALVIVARSDGIRVGEVATRIGASGPSASRLIRRLERHGLVSTHRDDDDRRATIVRATAAGAAAWSSVLERRRVILASAAAAVPSARSAGLADDLAVVAKALDQFV